jgi:hypothetical protein
MEILTRGKERAEDVRKNDMLQHLCLLRPKRGRFAKVMDSDGPLSPAHTWQAIHSIVSLCTRDFKVKPSRDRVREPWMAYLNEGWMIGLRSNELRM